MLCRIFCEKSRFWKVFAYLPLLSYALPPRKPMVRIWDPGWKKPRSWIWDLQQSSWDHIAKSLVTIICVENA
jgi:hypothetical protein